MRNEFVQPPLTHEDPCASSANGGDHNLQDIRHFGMLRCWVHLVNPKLWPPAATYSARNFWVINLQNFATDQISVTKTRSTPSENGN